MLIKPAPDIRASDITDEALYLDRRRFITRAGIALAGVAAGSLEAQGRPSRMTTS